MRTKEEIDADYTKACQRLGDIKVKRVLLDTEEVALLRQVNELYTEYAKTSEDNQ